MTLPKLFTPIQAGRVRLAHRVVLAPLTRGRANAQHVHSELAAEYYAQRASVPGTLLITEGTVIAAKATGVPFVPGVWTDEQIAAWRKVRLVFRVVSCLWVTRAYRSRMPCTRRGHIYSASCGR